MKRKLGINIDCLNRMIDEPSTLKLASEIGFEVFTTCSGEMSALTAIKEKAVGLGMEFPFLHSPFGGINNMWIEGDAYRKVFDGITHAIDVAAVCDVQSVVLHVSSGWHPPHVNDLGLSRYDALVEYAAGKNVTLAFENLRMVGNLACLIDRYEQVENVRFCYDCGHEHCYTKTVSWIDIFTDKIIATHLHDNMSRPFGNKTTDPDLHWLPFDGTFDYHSMMQKLDKYGYAGPLLLEVYRNVREDYKKLSAEEFMTTAYERLKRIADINAF
jgi:sugar phosphate isomerase/epimerase